MDKKVLEMAKNYGFDKVQPGKQWNGHNVWELDYNTPTAGGFPFILIEEDGNLRISSIKEAMEYFDFAIEPTMAQTKVLLEKGYTQEMLDKMSGKEKIAKAEEFGVFYE